MAARKNTALHRALQRAIAEGGGGDQGIAYVGSLLLLARHRKATRIALGMSVTGDRGAADQITAAARRSADPDFARFMTVILK